MERSTLDSHNLPASVLSRVHEGMHVVDRDGQDVGKVKAVFLGAVSELSEERGQGPADAPEPGGPADDTLLHHFARGMEEDEGLPEELRERLRRSGFIRIDTHGWFSSDRFATPEQIASVADETVTLRVARDDLLKK